MVKNLLALQDTCVRSLSREDPLEKGMGTHSSTLPWRIPWTEEPGGLQVHGIEESDTTGRLTLKLKVMSFSRVRLFATPWTIVYQAPQSMGFSRPGYWSGLPFPSPGDLPNPEIKARSPALQTDALPSEPPGKLLSNELHIHLLVFVLLALLLHGCTVALQCCVSSRCPAERINYMCTDIPSLVNLLPTPLHCEF